MKLIKELRAFVIQGLLGHEISETIRIYAQLRGSIRKEHYRKYFYH